MKKHALLFFLFSFSSFLDAQVMIGIHTGLGSVSSRYKGFDVSFSLGGTVEIPISEAFSIQSGIAWNSRSVNYQLFSDSEHWELDNLMIPLTCKFNNNWKGGQLYFKTGMFAGLLVQPVYYGRGAVDFVEVEYGLVLGGGLTAKMKRANLFMELEWRQGLNDLTDKNDSYDLQVASTEFIRVGLLFPLKLN